MEQSRKPAVAAEAHLGLVHLCANRFRERGIEYEELYSAGCLGLVKAANAFDAERGVCFSTYAVPVILGEIRRLFREGGSVHVGRRLQELGMRASRTAEQLRQQNGAEPTVRQIADALGISESETAEALCAAQPVASLTAGTDDGEGCTDIPVPSPENRIQEHLALEQVLSLLDARDRRLLHLRYHENLTQCQTAAQLGMTQVQVSRREKKILLFLRAELLK
ncbi:MAG: sigma-70 family RNA polymerase sigma factor [Oscillospiraceae bacterium]|jgi:RNA polymerase sporulation-specific sigma factor|nr:sigma-70 family RNA polymerase sigma factor [Oscillospiraceae bacterium]